MVNDAYIGVDVGGSHIGYGILLNNNRNELVYSIEHDLNPLLPPNDIINQISETIRSILISSSYNILAIGIGCPGHCKHGILYAASNLPKFIKVPIAKLLSDLLDGLLVILINDANAALAAEVWGCDLYNSCNNIAMITIGTGVGLGLMFNNKIHQGSNGLIEGGHMIIYPHSLNSNVISDEFNCSCGQIGCVEVFSSGKSTTNIYNSLVKDESLHVTGSKEIFDRAIEGDQLAIEVIDKATYGLALMCINICRIVDPDVIIFAGGMAKAGENLLQPIRKHIDKLTWTVLETNVNLVTARSINHAGIIGAAYAALHAYEFK